MKLKILASSTITPASAHANDQLVLKNDQGQSFEIYAKQLYKGIGIQYPKFYKMDELCQLAFLGTELLMCDVENWDGDKVAVVLGNKNSSLSSDTRHYKAIADEENYFPSPSVFVYTLPNIMLGEMCIRHKITGENSCFLMDQFDSNFLHQYVTYLFEKENYRHCITGFVDYTDERYIARLFLVGACTSDTPLAHDFDKNFK